MRAIGQELLPLASLTSMTLVGAEIVGRAYGGGLLKLEPKEADRLPVPALALVETAAARLRKIRQQVADLLHRGQLHQAVAIVDDVLLIGALGVTAADLGALRDAHAELTARGVPADRASVHRSFTRLCADGEAQRFEAAGRNYFELRREHHEHAVCDRCGTVEAVEGCVVVEGAIPGFAVTGHSVTFSGVCGACSP